MREHAVVIVGGGPTGLTLAAELALGGVDVAVVERRLTQELPGSRAGGLHARTIEVFDQRGIADRFLAEGQIAQVARFADVPLDISGFPTRHPYGLALWQNHIERILAGWVAELPVHHYRGREVTELAQDDDGVDVVLSDGERLRARWLVGCDGGRSFVRKAAGIDFPGLDPTTSWLIAEVETTEPPRFGFHTDARGVRHAMGPVKPGGPVRIVLTELEVGPPREPTLDELRAALRDIYGTDFGVHSPIWLSRFTDATRQAASYRQGRVLLAGDAAHVHPPQGGQGLNIGVQDAVNLGWKLAQVVRGTSPDTLLDTYHAERHPIAAQVLRTTIVNVALVRPGGRTQALADTLSELLSMEEPRKRYAGIMSGLDVHYALGEGHPLLGRRMPDLDLLTDGGPDRVYPLLHAARPVLLDFGTPCGIELGAWADTVRHVRAELRGALELPVLGGVPVPTAVLIRPDGYVGWVGEGSAQGLREALERWVGPRDG